MAYFLMTIAVSWVLWKTDTEMVLTAQEVSKEYSRLGTQKERDGRWLDRGRTQLRNWVPRTTLSNHEDSAARTMPRVFGEGLIWPGFTLLIDFIFDVDQSERGVTLGEVTFVLCSWVNSLWIDSQRHSFHSIFSSWDTKSFVDLVSECTQQCTSHLYCWDISYYWFYVSNSECIHCFIRKLYIRVRSYILHLSLHANNDFWKMDQRLLPQNNKFLEPYYILFILRQWKSQVPDQWFVIF